MSVISKLASTLGRKDEVPNQDLAAAISASEDNDAVKELVDHLSSKDKNIQSDCIKVLYEISEKKPALVADHIEHFVKLLQHKNNRMVWGAMAALDGITTAVPGKVLAHLDEITLAADKGSVIAKDHLVNILIELSGDKTNAAITLPILFDRLWHSLPNQFAMYAERSLPVMKNNRADFLHLLQTRIRDMEKESQKKRIEKLIKTVYK